MVAPSRLTPRLREKAPNNIVQNSSQNRRDDVCKHTRKVMTTHTHCTHSTSDKFLGSRTKQLNLNIFDRQYHPKTRPKMSSLKDSIRFHHGTNESDYINSARGSQFPGIFSSGLFEPFCVWCKQAPSGAGKQNKAAERDWNRNSASAAAAPSGVSAHRRRRGLRSCSRCHHT